MSYDYIRDIGKGSFARVDVVCDSVSCEQFAKKTYMSSEGLIENVGHDDLKRRFKREIISQKALDHPNVVSVVEDFLNEDPPSFIMPLAVCTLHDEIFSGEIKQEDVNKILFDILSGLEYIHSQGYVHRDLKPANILKFGERGDFRYAISDLGLIRAEISQSSTLTATNAQGGTANYAAPELITNFKGASNRADIYAFGAILHDIFGKNSQRVPYTELSLSGPIGNIIEKCTKTNSARRYADVSILRDELYKVLNESEISFSSTNEQRIIGLMEHKTDLDDDEWDSVFLQIEKNIADRSSLHNIMANLSLGHISSLKSNSPEIFKSMGMFFAESIHRESFDFEYCDVLASKAEAFYVDADIELKATIVVALLELGTSHNRFYVERKVSKMISKNIPNELANRIIVELNVLGIDFRRKMGILTSSINFDISNLHPLLVEIL